MTGAHRVLGVSWFDGSPTSYSAQDISGYWPIQGGALLETASDFVNAFTNSSMTVTGGSYLLDSVCLISMAVHVCSYDVGAVEKNCAGSALTYHVDLSASGSRTVVGSGCRQHQIIRLLLAICCACIVDWHRAITMSHLYCAIQTTTLQILQVQQLWAVLLSILAHVLIPQNTQAQARLRSQAIGPL